MLKISGTRKRLVNVKVIIQSLLAHLYDSSGRAIVVTLASASASASASGLDVLIKVV